MYVWSSKIGEVDLEYCNKELNNCGLKRTRGRLQNLAKNKSKKNTKLNKLGLSMEVISLIFGNVIV